MKKTTILTFFILLSFGWLSAQSLLPVRYGIKLGANIANVNSTPNNGVENINNSSSTGILAGFYIEIPLNDQWYINPEIIYTQKGFSFSYSYVHDYAVNQRDLHKSSNELKLGYAEINPTISYKAFEKLSLNLGLSHSVEMDIPDGIEVKMDGNTKLAITGPDKQMIGQFASVIRSKRPPEPFKGKGIRYAVEYIIRKEGKKK